MAAERSDMEDQVSQIFVELMLLYNQDTAMRVWDMNYMCFCIFMCFRFFLSFDYLKTFSADGKWN